MKKCVYILIFITSMVFAACNGGGNASVRNNGHEKFTTKKLQSVCLLDSTDENSPKYETEISIELVESENKEFERKINNSILNAIFGYENLAAEVAMDSFLTHAYEEYVDLRPEYLNEKQINANPAWFNFSLIINTHIEYGRKDIISYIIHCEHHTGGANPNSAYTIINFDRETGCEIKLNDIFKENYEEFLNNRLTDALADKIGANSRKDIQEKGYLTFNDIFPTENFIMKEDSILFYYNPYEIAPRAAGTTILGLTYDELSIIMK